MKGSLEHGRGLKCVCGVGGEGSVDWKIGVWIVEGVEVWGLKCRRECGAWKGGLA